MEALIAASVDNKLRGFMYPEQDVKNDIDNRKTLNDLIIYLKQLKKDGVVNDKQFNDLVAVVVANYVENEIQSMFAKTFNKGLSSLFKYF